MTSFDDTAAQLRQSRAMMSRHVALTLAVLALAVVALGGAQRPQSPFDCVTSTGYSGSCVNIYRCPPLLRLIQHVPLEQSDMEYLRSTRCGTEGNLPKVCCVPETTPVGPVGYRKRRQWDQSGSDGSA